MRANTLERTKADGFIATLSSQPVAVFDNVDEHIGWLPDHLAQITTGVAIGRRALYTTNEEVRFTPNCWTGLTSRTPKFLDGREDVLDRTLIFRISRLEKNVPEHRLLEEVEQNRNRLWSELLERLNDMVAWLTKNEQTAEVPYRMADFASFAIAVGKATGEEAIAISALNRMQGELNRTLYEQESLFECLREWLVTDASNEGRLVTSGELCEELRTVAGGLNFVWPYDGAKSLGQRLPNVMTNLKKYFSVDIHKDSSGRNHYAFWLKAETRDPSESPGRANQEREPIENTMHSGIESESLNHFSDS
jgi:hypothetical protein